MSIRVHELAKRCGLTSKEMIVKLHEMNYPVKTPSSTVDKITAESIEKEETAELGFDEKVARAVLEMTAIPGIEREPAEQLVRGGFHSLEGLLTADLSDLTDILGAEKAVAVQQAAIAEQDRREAAQTAEGEQKT